MDCEVREAFIVPSKSHGSRTHFPFARRQKNWLWPVSSQMPIHWQSATAVSVASTSKLASNQALVLAKLAGMLGSVGENGASPRATHMPSIKSRNGFAPFQPLHWRVYVHS